MEFIDAECLRMIAGIAHRGDCSTTQRGTLSGELIYNGAIIARRAARTTVPA
jgi:hypothetical protein